MTRNQGLAGRLAMVVLVFASPGVWATNIATGEFDCPLCGNRFEAEQVVSTSFGSGGDTDLMPISLGAPAYLVGAVTCPKCLYAGYSRDFDPATKLTAEQKEAIQRAPKPAMPAGEIRQCSDIRPSARYELAARTFAALGRPDLEIGFALLRGSWCEKSLDLSVLVPNHNYQRFHDVGMKVFWELPWLDRDQMEPRVYDLARAEQYLAAAKTRKGEERLACLHDALYTFAGYGVNDRVEEILPQLQEFMNQSAYNALAAQVREAIARQRSLQLRAAGYFVRAAAPAARQVVNRPTTETADRDGDSGPPTPGELAYLAGELYRRAGEPEKARQQFQRARESADLRPRMEKMLGTQEKLLPTTQPVPRGE